MRWWGTSRSSADCQQPQRGPGPSTQAPHAQLLDTPSPVAHSRCIAAPVLRLPPVDALVAHHQGVDIVPRAQDGGAAAHLRKPAAGWPGHSVVAVGSTHCQARCLAAARITTRPGGQAGEGRPGGWVGDNHRVGVLCAPLAALHSPNVQGSASRSSVTHIPRQLHGQLSCLFVPAPTTAHPVPCSTATRSTQASRHSALRQAAGSSPRALSKPTHPHPPIPTPTTHTPSPPPGPLRRHAPDGVVVLAIALEHGGVVADEAQRAAVHGHHVRLHVRVLPLLPRQHPALPRPLAAARSRTGGGGGV